MQMMIITSKFKKDSNGCANISLPFEESKMVNYDREYVVIIQPLTSIREVSKGRGGNTKVVIQS